MRYRKDFCLGAQKPGHGMLQKFVQSYTLGYTDGLRSMHVPYLFSTDAETPGAISLNRVEETRRIAYQQGFQEGIKDSSEILRPLSPPEDQILL